MTRQNRVRTILVLLAALIVAGDATDALAQTRKPRPQGFFGRLFGIRESSPGDSAPPSGGGGLLPFLFNRDVTFTDRSLAPRRIVPIKPPEPVIAAIPKDPRARKILVIGDFVAGDVAAGLTDELADEPKLMVIDASSAGSGLTRPEFYDWNQKLPELLNLNKPDIVVVALGANDRQQIRVGNQRLPVRSEGWEKAYTSRVAAIVDTLKVYGRPFFWVGAPPVRTGSASADMAYLNGLFKAQTEGAGGSFVDIWNGFADANGDYTAAGPDADGQVRALRTGDGVNFTRAGRQKLGFYVERDVRRKIGAGGAIELLPLLSKESRIEVGPDGQKILVGPVLSLTDPLPATTTLAGAGEAPGAGDESIGTKVIVKGQSLPPVSGRVDDFAWQPAAAPAMDAAKPN